MLGNVAVDSTFVKRIIIGNKTNSLKTLEAIPAETYKKCTENLIKSWHALFVWIWNMQIFLVNLKKIDSQE